MKHIQPQINRDIFPANCLFGHAGNFLNHSCILVGVLMRLAFVVNFGLLLAGGGFERVILSTGL